MHEAKPGGRGRKRQIKTLTMSKEFASKGGESGSVSAPKVDGRDTLSKEQQEGMKREVRNRKKQFKRDGNFKK